MDTVELTYKHRFDPFKPFKDEFGTLDRSDNQEYYFEAKGNKFGRVVGGLAWPLGMLIPGVALLVGEDLTLDHTMGLKHYRVLMEYESKNLDEIVEWCDMVADQNAKLAITWYCDTRNTPGMEFVWQYNDSKQRLNKNSMSIAPAPHVDHSKSFEFYINILKRHLRKDKKSLHFGVNSGIPHYMQVLSHKNAESMKDQHPGILSIGYAVSALSIWPDCGVVT